VIPIKFQVGQMYFKRNPWHGLKKISLNYSPAFFAIFDDFRVFWMKTWTIPYFARGSRKSGSFLCQLNGYLAMSTFRNRKYRTVLFFQIWKMSFVFLLKNIKNHKKLTWKIWIWSCLGSNLWGLVHFCAYSSTKLSCTVSEC
jgi:hypothetical protein